MFVNVCPRGGDHGPPLYRFASMPKPATKYVCPPRFPKQYKSDLEFYPNFTDPRVRRGFYAMDLGPKTPELPFYPCFDMVKKDPVCRLYLRTLKKCLPVSIDEKTNELKISSSFGGCRAKSPRKVKSKDTTDDVSIVGKSTQQCQTDTYYEILEDEAPRVPNSTQTDPISDLSYTLLGTPMQRNEKTGEDAETEIIVGDLFYFDEEIANNVLNCVNAVVEQALLELMMESELDALMAQQRAYEAKRNLELARLQNLQKRKQGIVDEHAKLLAKEREAMEKATQAGEIVPTGMFAKHFLHDVLVTGKEVAEKAVALEEVDDTDAHPVMKWIKRQTRKLHWTDITSRDLLDDMLRNTAASREASHYPMETTETQEEGGDNDKDKEYVGEGDNDNNLEEYDQNPNNYVDQEYDQTAE